MQNKLFDRPLCAGGGNLFWVFFLLWFVSPKALMCQTPDPEECTQVTDCDELKLEIVRVNQTMTSGCSVDTQACNANNVTNNFSQTIYKVYLRYTPNTLPDTFHDFYLDYATLNVKVGLMFQSGSSRLSHIDNALSRQLTQNAHSEWNFGNKVIIELDKAAGQSMTINFQNTDTPTVPCSGEVGERILFKWGSTMPLWPPDCVQHCQPIPNLTQQCAFAHLMTIVVNAYPGESFSLDRIIGHYAPFDKIVGVTCDPIPRINGQATNIVHNGIVPITVPTPNTHASTTNANLRVRFANQQSTPSGTTIDVELVNGGTNIDPDLTVSYAEMIVKLVHIGAEQPVSTSVSARIISTTESDGRKSKLLYFVSTPNIPVVLLKNYGNALKIATITLGKTTVANAAYTSILRAPDSLASRVVTNVACTSLPLNPNPFAFTTDGHVECSYADLVEFILKGDSINPNATCDAPKYVTLGFKTAHPDQNMQVEYLKFELDFEWTAGITVDSIILGDLRCPASGTCSLTHQFTNKRFTYELSMSGSAKQLELNPDALMRIKFTGGGCIDGVKLTYLEMRRPTENSCIPDYQSTYSGFPICIPGVAGSLKTETGDGLEDGEIAYTSSDSCSPSSSGCTIPSLLKANKNGNFRNCPCVPCENFNLEPSFDYVPLNGVSTYDLVLISKHILGLEALASAYKMIAADANNSGSISTFDIVEFRKLILGIYTELPANKSWRFVLKSFAFPDPDNPFKTAFPEKGAVKPDSSIYESDFIAIKVGDVNNSAVAHSRPELRPTAAISWVSDGAKSGEMLTVPVRFMGEQEMEAIQLGLRFDPAALRLIGPSKGDLPGLGSGNFNLSGVAKGEIKMLWTLDMMAPERLIQPGDVLFYLTFKVVGRLPESELPLQLDNFLFDGAAWQADGKEYALSDGNSVRCDRVLAEVGEPALFQAFCHPNPSSGGGSITIQSDKTVKGRVFLFDAFGNRLTSKDMVMQAGEQTFALPGSDALPAGVYLWQVQSEGKKVQGRWIKQ